MELTLRYTTPDIHCRHRRHECDGGIILDLLGASYLRLGEVVIETVTVIKFGVDNRGGNGGGCFGVIVRTDVDK